MRRSVAAYDVIFKSVPFAEIRYFSGRVAVGLLVVGIIFTGSKR